MSNTRLFYGQSQERVYIYVDISRLWARCEQWPCLAASRWQLDLKLLKNLVAAHTERQAEDREFHLSLSGRAAPSEEKTGPTETENGGHKSSSQNRGDRCETWPGAEIIADCVDRAHDACRDRIPAEFVIVSDELEIYPAVARVARLGFKVHVWTWGNRAIDGLGWGEGVSVHALDDYLDVIGIHKQ